MSKPGIKTSEFWITLAVILGAAATIPFGGPAWIAAACAAASAGCYTVSRTIAKTKTDKETLKALVAELAEMNAEKAEK